MSDRILDWEFPGPWPYEGTVVNRIDPENLGRVTVRIPGELEPESNWALPVGCKAGGSKDHGASPKAPPVGATVLCFFVNGERENIRFLAGHYGRGEVPKGHVVSEDGDNFVWRDGKVQVEVDSRSGSYGVRVTDVATESAVKLDVDLAGRQVGIESDIGINIKTKGSLRLQGGQVLVNGRPIMPVGPPL